MRKWYIFGAAALALVLVASSPFIWHEISQRRYYHNLTKELMEEEEQGKEIEIKPTATDNYINDFKYTSTVKIGRRLRAGPLVSQTTDQSHLYWRRHQAALR